MNLFELCQHKFKTDPQYKVICESLKKRSENVHIIKDFLVKHRKWPEDKAIQLANDIVDSGKTIKEYLSDCVEQATAR